jgi:pimeloyl-ACP methyl ester carboxylesterase
VFVHGLVGDFTHFEHVATPLSRRFRVAGLDLPGCGISCKPNVRHTIRGYAETLLSWLEQRKLGPVTLVGHSAGGQVSAEAALLSPSSVRRLVLIGASGMRRFPPAVRKAAGLVMRPWLLSRTLDRLAIPILDQVFVTRNAYTEKFVKDALDRPTYPTLHEMAKVFHDLVPELLTPSILENTARFRMPVLIVWGESDRLIPKEAVSRVAAELPNVILKALPVCGHMPMIECPDEVVRAIEEFCGDNGATTRTIPHESH